MAKDGEESTVTEFPIQLRRLIAPMMKEARKSPEAGAEMVEALASALAMAVANTSRGDPAAIDEMCSGLDAYILEGAARHAKMIRFIMGLPPQQESETSQ